MASVDFSFRTISDLEILRQFQLSNDNALFEELMIRYDKKLRRWIKHKYTIEDNVVDDVMQNTWIVVAAYKKDIRVFNTWIKLIVVRHACNYFRKFYRQKELGSRGGSDLLCGIDDLGDSIEQEHCDNIMKVVRARDPLVADILSDYSRSNTSLFQVMQSRTNLCPRKIRRRIERIRKTLIQSEHRLLA